MTPPGSLPSVSVIIPCRNERHYIGPCLDSLLAQDYPRERLLEILVVDGHSDDGTRAVVQDYATQHPIIRLVDNPRTIPPAALNIGIRESRGDVIVRVDAHATYPPVYVSRLIAAQIAHGADNVGGAIATVPADDSPTARAIATALSHRFGVGDSYFRIGTEEPRWVDTIAFFCCRREVFDRVGGFDEDLARGEDCEFNFRLRQQGGRVLLVPGAEARYYARRTLGQVARMLFQYGYFKALLTGKLRRTTSWRQLVPPGFVAALIGTFILGLWTPVGRLLFGGLVGAYAIAVALSAVVAGRSRGLAVTLRLPATFAVMHFSYGIGFLKSVVDAARGARQQGPPGGVVRLSR